MAEQLRAAGLEVDVQPVKAISDLTGYEAIILGSAVFYGSWMKEAVNFAQPGRVEHPRSVAVHQWSAWHACGGRRRPRRT
jgi:menaquinone-dependent protoporphyrinogen IX oxidase